MTGKKIAYPPRRGRRPLTDYAEIEVAWAHRAQLLGYQLGEIMIDPVGAELVIHVM